ncbi:hypothetical protein HY3_16410 [Hyphomonas pacifica]|uniref:RNA signal recognition particle 4.5S RNA n=2 Tax=Hyphomonas pacifica TaxID=1280941 RepID=A0A8B2PKG1_9PROT|nr:hypothetical protein HY3_16410 [Hyphomonas pacifica]
MTLGDTNMTYVDGMVAAVPEANKAAYLDHAKKTAELFKEAGALSVVECWGADVPEGKLTSMPMAVKLEEGETVVLSWISWPSKDARDAAWEKLMADERMAGMEMPFDGSRMIFGGFDVVLDA